MCSDASEGSSTVSTNEAYRPSLSDGVCDDTDMVLLVSDV